MAKNAVGHSREEIVQQVIDKEESVHEYGTYVPVGNAVKKISAWIRDGAEIVYLTSRRTEKEINDIQAVLDKYNFPKGELVYRQGEEAYANVAERIMPDILIEDDCESIGGTPEMTYPHIIPALKDKIKSIPVVEFGGIDYLPDLISDLATYKNK